jgi:hypothetical protein
VLLHLVIGVVALPGLVPVLVVLAPVNCALLVLLAGAFVRMRPVDDAGGSPNGPTSSAP